jgi:hypothetical protein
LAHILVGEPVTTPDQVRGGLSPDMRAQTRGLSSRMPWLSIIADAAVAAQPSRIPPCCA